jgi:hypothetical protein
MTDFAHLLQDYLDQGLSSRFGHFFEWTYFVSGNTTDTFNEMRYLMDIDYSIHFHCWDYKLLKKVLTKY